jgi:3-deoxy-D-arabino-heptulosonate 7-phosphate (DAHP) synthase
MSEPTDAAVEAAVDPAAEAGTDAPVEPAIDADVAADADPGVEPAVDPDVAAALADLEHRPLAEHAEVYTELHAQLQRTLAEIDGG